MSTCDYCGSSLTNWDFRYREKHYCRQCSDKLFPVGICKICNENKRIYINSINKTCKICEVRDEPCLRCGKSRYAHGKILKNGTVCASCAKYFTTLKVCSECGMEKTNVSSRKLSDNVSKLLCINCYNKTLLVCSSCGYRRKIFAYSLNKKPLCKICTQVGFKECKKCNKKFPAGFGNICSDCIYKNTLNKKVKFISSSLSKDISSIFIEYTTWLKERRGLQFCSLNIQLYYEYFYILDELYICKNKFPIYADIVHAIKSRKLSTKTLPIKFLHERLYFSIDQIEKERCSEIETINKYLKFFEKDSFEGNLINKYHKTLLLKHNSKKITIRSIRLALTPAVKFLQYCQNFKKGTNFIDMLKGYLCCYAGQRAAISGFIGFLNHEGVLNVRCKDIQVDYFTHIKTTKEHLRHRLLKMLRMEKISSNKVQYFLKLLVGYFHGIEVSDYVYIDVKNIKIDQYKNSYILLNKKKIFIGRLKGINKLAQKIV